MLGVPRDLVRADYTLTEYCLARDEAVIEDGRAPKSDPIRAPLMRADAAYIDAMFERLEGQFGTTHAYLDEALGVDAAMRAQIADRLLEPA